MATIAVARPQPRPGPRPASLNLKASSSLVSKSASRPRPHSIQVKSQPTDPGLTTFLSDAENASLCKPVPSPYLIAPLCIGPLDTPSVTENEHAYERHHFFKEMNDAARSRRRPFYDGGMYGWLPIYFNREWAAFLKRCETDRENKTVNQGAGIGLKVKGAEEEKMVRKAVERDAGLLVPDTDLDKPMQDLLKAMYREYIVDEEIRRRLEGRKALRRRVAAGELQVSSAGAPSNPAGEKMASKQRSRRIAKGEGEKVRRVEDKEKSYQRMVDQLTTFADFQDEKELVCQRPGSQRETRDSQTLRTKASEQR